jgi:Ion transport protein
MSLAIFFLWLKFFYFLRIFKPTSAFIRMITEIIKDMGIFSLIYLLANISIANALFVLDGSLNKNAVEVTTYDGYLGTMASVYLNGLGDFSTDNFKGHPNEELVWIYFFILTVLITLVLLNLLIAIMGDTFDRVQEMKDEAMLKELCCLISDNWFWLNQKKTFAKTKYICIAKLEQADSVGAGGWEGKLATLKTFF